MKVILLAAGAATRLRPLTENVPKCLLDVGGESILARQVRTLGSLGLRRFTIVDGFGAVQVREHLRARFPDGWFEFVHSDSYATTDNAVSLLLARPARPEPIFVVDADVVFEPGVPLRMLENASLDRLALRTQGELDDEEIKMRLDARGCVVDLGKGIDPALSAGESIGLAVFSARTGSALFRVLDKRVREEKRVREWYEPSFVELIGAGVTLRAVDLGELACIEIDTEADLLRARAMVDARFRQTA